MSNSNQIDNADYYLLPCGAYLEDFIANRGLDFATGSVIKYLWRAGRKDGESAEKDKAKAKHYIDFICRRRNCDDIGRVWFEAFTIGRILQDAIEWNGDDA